MLRVALRNIESLAKNAPKNVRGITTYSEYPFLKELGILPENPGLFDGKWGGSGQVGSKFFFPYLRKIHLRYVNDFHV